MNDKPIWQSKTFWFNVGMLAVAVGSGQFGVPIPPAVAVPIVTAGNIILRLVSNQGVTLT